MKNKLWWELLPELVAGSSETTKGLLIPIIEKARPFILTDEIATRITRDTSWHFDGLVKRKYDASGGTDLESILELEKVRDNALHNFQKLPFPVVWLEFIVDDLPIGTYTTSALPGDGIIDMGRQDGTGPEISVPVCGLGIIEVAPNEYTCLAVGYRPDTGDTMTRVMGVQAIEQLHPEAVLTIAIAGTILKQIAEKDVVYGKPTLPRVYAQNRKKRAKFNKIKDITIVSTRKVVQEGGCPQSPSNTVWTHSWEVSGHWRTVKGIGKNREGSYVVPGFTWVVPCIKGEGPLVAKTRVVVAPKV